MIWRKKIYIKSKDKQDKDELISHEKRLCVSLRQWNAIATIDTFCTKEYSYDRDPNPVYFNILLLIIYLIIFCILFILLLIIYIECYRNTKFNFKHIYFTSIDKQVLTTYTNLSRNTHF